MCLRCISNEELVAEYDIHCYKLVERGHACGCPYKTPFQDTHLTQDIVDGIIPYVAEGEKGITRSHPTIPDAFWIVEGGYVHSYVNYEDAKSMCDFCNEVYANLYFVFECIIPKGTKYLKGITEFRDESYASEQMIFVRMMKNKNYND